MIRACEIDAIVVQCAGTSRGPGESEYASLTSPQSMTHSDSRP